jgi:VanZ family protein
VLSPAPVADPRHLLDLVIRFVGIGLVPLLMVVVAAVEIRKRRHGESRGGRLLLLVLTGLWVTVVLAVTLIPDGGWAGTVELRPFSTSTAIESQNVVGNILLFVPLGLLVGALSSEKKRFIWVFLSLVVASALVEVVQYAVVAGRTASTTDVILNSLGAAVGLTIAGIVAAIVEGTVHRP